MRKCWKLKESLVLLVVVFLGISASLSACTSKQPDGAPAGKDTQEIQVVNPLLHYQTIAEAREAVGFAFSIPTRIPEGYVQTDILTIDRKIAQIVYKNKENEITYRTAKGSDAKGSEDISGDYNLYSTTKTVSIGQQKVEVKGENTEIRVATWEKANECYSLVFTTGITEAQLAEIINSIK
ncbi:MAG TPA: hypothetical protein DD727_03380 [Clostridiales bacterium]|nr:hypothetical protein [Clostridiales bacterium]